MYAEHWLCSLSSTAFKHSIYVRSVFTFCAIIANQSYIKDFLNFAFQAQILNFQMLDKVNDDSSQKYLLLYFMLKNKNKKKQEDKVYRFRMDFSNV